MSELPQEDQEKSMGAEQGTTPTHSSSKKKTWIITWVVVLLLAIAAGLAFNMGYISSPGEKKVVVARINNQPLYAEQVEIQFRNIEALLEAQGIDTADPEVIQSAQDEALQRAITEEVMYQHALADGLVASDAIVQSEYESLFANFSSQEAFDEALAENGITEAMLRNDLSRQLTVQAYIESVIDEDAIIITDEEIQELYERFQNEVPGTPDLADARPVIESQIKQQKVNDQITILIDQLRANALIEVVEGSS